MRLPVPTNKLVAFTLVGALLTAIVAGALVVPGGGLAETGEQPNPVGPGASDPPRQIAADAPTPNPDFTPAVQTQAGYEDEEHEEYEGDEEDEDEHEGEDEDHEEEHGEEE